MFIIGGKERDSPFSLILCGFAGVFESVCGIVRRLTKGKAGVIVVLGCNNSVTNVTVEVKVGRKKP